MRRWCFRSLCDDLIETQLLVVLLLIVIVHVITNYLTEHSLKSNISSYFRTSLSIVIIVLFCCTASFVITVRDDMVREPVVPLAVVAGMSAALEGHLVRVGQAAGNAKWRADTTGERSGAFRMR